MKRKIVLPVIERITVTNYPLYPGIPDGAGINHSVSQGITVIAGINGQGKTTLLNMLFRALVGPQDLRKADIQQPGARRHDTVDIKDYTFFVERINGASCADAFVEITVKFGKDRVRIKRNLGPRLSIVELWHNRTKLEQPDEGRWAELVREISGLDPEYEFYFVVRYFLFFLEDKVSLLWNPYGQFEILRILFTDEELAKTCANLHDQILQLDSQYRNLNWQLGQDEQQLTHFDQILAAEAPSMERQDNEATLFERLKYLQAERLVQAQNLGAAIRRVESLDEQIYRTDLKLDSAIRELEQAEQKFFVHAFPNASDNAKLVFASLLSGESCLVCESHVPKAAAAIRDLIDSNRCPACRTQLPEAENVSFPLKTVQQRLKRLDRSAGILRNALEQLRLDHESALDTAQVARSRFFEVSQQEALIQHKLDTILGATTGAHTVISELRRTIQSRKTELDNMDLQLIGLRKKYRERLGEAHEQILRASTEVKKIFDGYATEFLLEDAELSFEMHERRIGQGGAKLKFPNFVVKMTSSVSSGPVARDEADNVSESQREFLDLAFRMALLEVSSRAHGSLMLVIETPEASLDHVFIERAAAMLQKFASGENGNIVIASSNLNGERMIGELLGTYQKPVRRPAARQAVERQVLNLLRLAAPTKAYQRKKKEYDETYERAVFGTV